MADVLRVNTDLLERCASELKQAAHGFADAASILDRLNVGEEWWEKVGNFGTLYLQDEGGSAAMGNARTTVTSMANVLRRYNSRMTRLGENASRAASMFSSTESALASKAQGQGAGRDGVINPSGAVSGVAAAGSTSEQRARSEGERALAKALGYPEDRSKWTKEMHDKYNQTVKDGEWYYDAAGGVAFVAGGMTVISDARGNVSVQGVAWREKTVKRYNADGSYSETNGELKIGSTFWKDKKDRADRTPESWKDWSKRNTDDGAVDPSRKRTWVEFGVDASKSKSAFHYDGKYENGAYSNSTTVDIGKKSLTAKLMGGLYQTSIDENGKERRVLEPGIAAEIGVSYTALEVVHKGRYGNDYVGVNYGVGTKEGHVGLKAETQLGIVDKKLAARVSGSAEFIAGEVSAEGGVDVVGVDVRAKGTLNYGIGAHLDAGVYDGKITCDLGLSIGVGASVKLEVDYGKAVDNLVNAAQEAYNGVANKVSAIKSACSGWFKW